ncbi:MAG: P-II family nitrogen regulator [Ignavibacteriales bacterium]
MKKVEAIVRPSKLEDIKDALNKYGIHGMTVTPVTGCGFQKGYKEVFRGTEYTINLIQKVKIEIVLKDESLDNVIQILLEAGRTGEIGDGKIFICDIEDAITIRTGERGENEV